MLVRKVRVQAGSVAQWRSAGLISPRVLVRLQPSPMDFRVLILELQIEEAFDPELI